MGEMLGWEYSIHYGTFTAKGVKQSGLPLVGGGKGTISKKEYSEKYANVWLSKTRCNKIKRPVEQGELPVAFYRVTHGYQPLFYRGEE